MGVPAAVGLAGSLLVAAPPLRPVLAVGSGLSPGRAWGPRSRGRDDLPRVVDRPRRPPPGSPPERPRPVTRIVSPTAGSHRPGIPAPSRPKPSHRHPGAACVIRRVAVARLINKLRVPPGGPAASGGSIEVLQSTVSPAATPAGAENRCGCPPTSPVLGTWLRPFYSLTPGVP